MDTCEVLIRNANLFDVGEGLDVAIRDGKIAEVGHALPLTAPVELDATDKLVVPSFVESHTHLDKALTAEGQDAPTLEEAYDVLVQTLDRVPADQKVEDIKARSRRVLDWELAAGSGAVKSHVLVDTRWGMDSLQAIQELKEEYKGRLDLYNIVQWIPEYDKEFRAAAKAGQIDFIAGYPLFTPDPMGDIDKVFELAQEFDLPLDLHIDENDSGNVDCFLSVIEHTRRYHMEGRVTCGHVTALNCAPDDVAERAIRESVEAGINIITLPSCNMYLMGRKDHQPIRRGVTRVDEFLKAGSNVSVASDNVRDPYRPFGNGDLLEEALFAAQVLQYGKTAQLDEIMRMITSRPARNTLIKDYGLDVGCRADLVVLDAPTAKEAIISQVDRLWVLKGGNIVAKNGKLC